MFNTPILFLIFNRPDTTQRVFEEIKKIKPAKLFIAADGPRDRVSGEKENCEQTRKIVLENIDWECQTETRFHDTNLGCKKAVSSAIDWFFEQNEEGIVLEDDCLPHLDFFRFCQQLLERYRNTENVMQICGFNPLGEINTPANYYFSRYGPIWGWASWKRAWEKYDVNLTSWPQIKKSNRYKTLFYTSREAKWRSQLYDKVYRGDIDTWDYQWGFTKFINEGLSVMPSKNMVKNIGFGSDATHTTSSTDKWEQFPIFGLPQYLTHPGDIKIFEQADKKYLSKFVFNNPSVKRILKRIKSFLAN